MKKLSLRDLCNRNIEILLLYNDDKLSHVKCRSNIILEEFLTKIMPYLTEKNIQTSIDFFFKNRMQKVTTRVSGWISINVTGMPPKRKKGANNQQHGWPAYERLVYLIGHYKSLQGIRLECRLNEDKSKVVLKLRLNAKAVETYEADIKENNVAAAKDEAAGTILKRLGF